MLIVFDLSSRSVDESESTVKSRDISYIPFFSANAIASSLVPNVSIMLDRGSALKNTGIMKSHSQKHGKENIDKPHE